MNNHNQDAIIALATTALAPHSPNSDPQAAEYMAVDLMSTDLPRDLGEGGDIWEFGRRMFALGLELGATIALNPLETLDLYPAVLDHRDGLVASMNQFTLRSVPNR